MVPKLFGRLTVLFLIVATSAAGGTSAAGARGPPPPSRSVLLMEPRGNDRELRRRRWRSGRSRGRSRHEHRRHGERQRSGTTRRARIAGVDVSRGLPLDLADPEGRSRWASRALRSSRRRRRRRPAKGVALGRSRALVGLAAETVRKPRLTRDARADGAGPVGLVPSRRHPDLMRPGLPDDDRAGGDAGDPVGPVSADSAGRTTEDRGPEPNWIVAPRRRPSRLRLEVEVVGLGLDSTFRPDRREAVLQRVLALRESVGRARIGARALIDRWVDPRAGIVAEVSGPVSSDGGDVNVDGAWADELLTSVADLKIDVGELIAPTLFHDLITGREPRPRHAGLHAHARALRDDR